MSMFRREPMPPPAAPVIRRHRPPDAFAPPPREPPLAAVLARASSPTDAQVALREVIIAMAGDAARAGLSARAECERLDDTVRLMQQHVFEVVDDYAERLKTVTEMYNKHR